MRRFTLVTLALAGLGTWAAACGGSDDGGTVPDVDAGPDTSTTAVDTGVPDVLDTDTGLDAGNGDAGLNLDGGLCGGGVVVLGSAAPQFAWASGATPITIAGTGFIATPKVYLRNASGTLTQIQHVAFVSSTNLTAIVPANAFPAGTYDLVVVNPNSCAASLAGGLRVVTNAPPTVLSVTPAAGTTQTDVPVTVTGCHFPANATLSTVSSAGTLVVMTSAAPTAGANDARCNNTPLYTMTGTIQTNTKALTAGAYLVRVTNPTDNTFGEYASFTVTNPSGNLTGGFVASSTLNTGRRSHGLVSGRVNTVSRFLYAVGGEQANGTPLNTVEVGPLERFGSIGKWFVQKNKLQTARSGHATVQFGKWIYVLGGTDNPNGSGGTTPAVDPLDDIERAKILDATFAPVVADPPTVSTASGTLAAGTWYYRVSSVGADIDDAGGESLASDEVVATLTAAGSVTLTWPAITGATKYKVYRTQAADGVSGAEVFLADVGPEAGATLTYTDTGAVAPNVNETYMPLGSTGQWEQSATTFGLAGVGRVNASAAVAVAPGGTQAYLYLTGGWGRCTGDSGIGIQRCVEYAPLDAATGDVGAFTTVVTAMNNARMRGGAAVLDKSSGPPAFTDGGAPANAAFLVVAGGRGASTLGSATNVEYALIGSNGAPGAFANAGGFSGERDGLGFQIVNGYGYALQGGTPPNNYTQTTDQSTQALVTASTITFSTWSNAAANLGGANKVGRHGATSEGAFFYIAGGTSNDSDALSTVWRVIH